MKVCVLQASYEGTSSPFKDCDPYSDLGYWFRNHPGRHTFETVLIKKATASQQIRDLQNKGYDVFVQLCDGSADEERAGMEVVQLLEKYNLPYTGADPKFYEPTKELQKMMAYYYGVRTPNFIFAFNDEDIELASTELKFPMIIKHFNGYGSVGMTAKSRVTNKEELYFQARKMIQEYEGALIEEFIEGREVTVLVAENVEDPLNPYVLEPVECKFGNGETFKHFDLKWRDCSNIKWVPIEDRDLVLQVQELTKKIFVGLGGVGYGRTDIRVNDKGEAYFLEINPNCGIFYEGGEGVELGSADFILIKDPTFDHIKFIEHIMDCAIKRAKKRIKKTAVRFKPNIGYGVYASRDINEGEVVQELEEKAQYMATKSHVEREWHDPLRKSWFDKYAYPVTDQTYILWSENPTEWMPTNHSCDPNTWLVGLNTAARRNIKKGEHITMDYSTFCCDNMETFKCMCKSSDCRGTVTGRDYLKSFVEKYGDHVSDYVKLKRSQYKHSLSLDESIRSNGVAH